MDYPIKRAKNNRHDFKIGSRDSIEVHCRDKLKACVFPKVVLQGRIPNRKKPDNLLTTTPSWRFILHSEPDVFFRHLPKNKQNPVNSFKQVCFQKMFEQS